MHPTHARDILGVGPHATREEVDAAWGAEAAARKAQNDSLAAVDEARRVLIEELARLAPAGPTQHEQVRAPPPAPKPVASALLILALAPVGVLMAVLWLVITAGVAPFLVGAAVLGLVVAWRYHAAIRRAKSRSLGGLFMALESLLMLASLFPGADIMLLGVPLSALLATGSVARELARRHP